MVGIYEICNLHDGKATAYVGSSTDVKRRWRQHRSLLRRGKHDNPHLQRAWDKYGEAAFGWGVIEEVRTVANLLERERYWLDRYLENPDTCYNLGCDVTAPMRGRNHTDEAKRKMSEVRTGRALSKEHRRKISEANKGKVPWNKGEVGIYSEETRRSLREASTGRRHTDETKRKLSKCRARPYPAFICRGTGEVIPAGRNLAQLCREYGLNRRHMWAVAHGQRKHHKGWLLASQS